MGNYLQLANIVFADSSLKLFNDDTYWSLVFAFFKLALIAIMLYGINHLTVHFLPIQVKRRNKLVLLFILVIFVLLLIFLIIIKRQASDQLFLNAGAVTDGFIFPLACLVAGSQAVTLFITFLVTKDPEKKKENLKGLIILAPYLILSLVDIIVLANSSAQAYVRFSYLAIMPLVIISFLDFRAKPGTKEASEIQNSDRLDHICEKFGISDREKDVLNLVIQGEDHKNIADKLFISVNTVKTHLQNIYKKMKVSGKLQLMIRVNSITD